MNDYLAVSSFSQSFRQLPSRNAATVNSHAA